MCFSASQTEKVVVGLCNGYLAGEAEGLGLPDLSLGEVPNQEQRVPHIVREVPLQIVLVTHECAVLHDEALVEVLVVLDLVAVLVVAYVLYGLRQLHELLLYLLSLILDVLLAAVAGEVLQHRMQLIVIVCSTGRVQLPHTLNQAQSRQRPRIHLSIPSLLQCIQRGQLLI